MITLKTKFGDIQKSNLVFLIETSKELKKLEFLGLEKKIIQDIEKWLREKKNIKKVYFIGNTHFENLIVLIYKDTKKSLIDASWPMFETLPHNYTILSNKEANDEHLLTLWALTKYSFEDYKTEKQEKNIFFLTSSKQEKKCKKRLKTLECVLMARQLWSMPSSDLTPASFAKRIKNYKWKNTKIRILSSKEIEKKKLWLIHAVWKWSAHKPYMVILERIVDKKAPTYAIVWKGITFDSGWIQVKPDNSMYEMKWDMCWAAAVFATMKNIDRENLNVNIIACICLAENAISSTSYRPSDILTSYSGKTVDVIHTDAEWRLVLADGVSYISKNYRPDNIMTIATLTWACMVALWFRYAWIMGNDRKTINSLLKNSQSSYEKYHELPFDDYFREKCKSDVADLENLNRSIYAWATMWGAFISHFCLNDEKYTHLDIAWPALNWYEAYGVANKWMTWFWVESLSNFYTSL